MEKPEEEMEGKVEQKKLVQMNRLAAAAAAHLREGGKQGVFGSATLADRSARCGVQRGSGLMQLNTFAAWHGCRRRPLNVPVCLHAPKTTFLQGEHGVQHT